MENCTSVKEKLIKNNLTQTWLICRLGERGITTDKTELSNALSGRRMTRKKKIILSESEKIIDDYEQKMAINKKKEYKHDKTRI
jgi:hypothetical protein